jgi:hypothetical protein
MTPPLDPNKNPDQSRTRRLNRIRPARLSPAGGGSRTVTRGPPVFLRSFCGILRSLTQDHHLGR